MQRHDRNREYRGPVLIDGTGQVAASGPSRDQTRSRISAIPCPTPMHIVHNA